MKKIYFLLSVSVVLVLTASCNTDNDATKKGSCSIENLLLEPDDYPSGTIINDINSPIDEKPNESASRTANFNSDAIGQIVIRFSSTDRTSEEYQLHQKSIFENDEVIGSWDTPSVFLEMPDLSANSQEIACGNVRSFGNRCFMIGQYEEYFVLFSADISDAGVTHELFRDLVLKIDKKMSSCLDR